MKGVFDTVSQNENESSAHGADLMAHNNKKKGGGGGGNTWKSPTEGSLK